MGLIPNLFETYTLEEQEPETLNYSMNQALKYWHISNNIISNRRRLSKNVA
jgi:hypothetical protein